MELVPATLRKSLGLSRGQRAELHAYLGMAAFKENSLTRAECSPRSPSCAPRKRSLPGLSASPERKRPCRDVPADTRLYPEDIGGDGGDSPRAMTEAAVGSEPACLQASAGQSFGYDATLPAHLEWSDAMHSWPTQQDFGGFAAVEEEDDDEDDSCVVPPFPEVVTERLERSRQRLGSCEKVDVIMAIIQSENALATDSLPRAIELESRSKEDLESLAMVMGLKHENDKWCLSTLSKEEQASVVTLVLETEGIRANTKPKSDELQAKSKAKLELIAVAMGIKRAGVGWKRCCPLRGAKADIVSAIMRAWELNAEPMTELEAAVIERGILLTPVAGGVGREDFIHAMLRFEALRDRSLARAKVLRKLSLAPLEALAVKLGIKIEGVGWARSCPPEGSKANLVSALLRYEEVLCKTKVQVQALAADAGLWEKGGSWARCCPPSGRKSDIVLALWRGEAKEVARRARSADRAADLVAKTALELEVLARELGVEAKAGHDDRAEFVKAIVAAEERTRSEMASPSRSRSRGKAPASVNPSVACGDSMRLASSLALPTRGS